MGQITNLIVRTKTGDKYLFEAKNTLPFFWSVLLDERIIEMGRKAWTYYDRLVEQNDEEALEKYTDQLPDPLWLYISKDAFECNRKAATDYLQKYNPEAVSLFTGFCNYIDAQYDGDDKFDESFIMLDIIGLAGFNNSACEFMDILLLETNKIKNNIQSNWDTFDLIAFGTGFSCAGFDLVSAEYQTILQKRNPMFGHLQNDGPVKPGFSWKRLTGWLITLLLCPVFSYLTYKGYLKEGFSFRVILLGICNIGFYIFSIWALIGEIQALLKLKK